MVGLLICFDVAKIGAAEGKSVLPSARAPGEQPQQRGANVFFPGLASSLWLPNYMCLACALSTGANKSVMLLTPSSQPRNDIPALGRRCSDTPAPHSDMTSTSGQRRYNSPALRSRGRSTTNIGVEDIFTGAKQAVEIGELQSASELLRVVISRTKDSRKLRQAARILLAMVITQVGSKGSAREAKLLLQQAAAQIPEATFKAACQALAATAMPKTSTLAPAAAAVDEWDMDEPRARVSRAELRRLESAEQDIEGLNYAADDADGDVAFFHLESAEQDIEGLNYATDDTDGDVAFFQLFCPTHADPPTQ